MTNKTLSRLLTLTMLLVVGSILLTSTNMVMASADDPGDMKVNLGTVKTNSTLPGETDTTGNTVLFQTIGNIIKVFLSFLAIIFIILVIYAGFLWMTSQGDESKVTTARKLITNAIIGLVIILASYIITDFVITKVLDATTTTTTTRITTSESESEQQ